MMKPLYIIQPEPVVKNPIPSISWIDRHSKNGFITSQTLILCSFFHSFGHGGYCSWRSSSRVSSRSTFKLCKQPQLSCNCWNCSCFHCNSLCQKWSLRFVLMDLIFIFFVLIFIWFFHFGLLMYWIVVLISSVLEMFLCDYVLDVIYHIYMEHFFCCYLLF